MSFAVLAMNPPPETLEISSRVLFAVSTTPAELVLACLIISPTLKVPLTPLMVSLAWS